MYIDAFKKANKLKYIIRQYNNNGNTQLNILNCLLLWDICTVYITDGEKGIKRPEGPAPTVYFVESSF